MHQSNESTFNGYPPSDRFAPDDVAVSWLRVTISGWSPDTTSCRPYQRECQYRGLGMRVVVLTVLALCLCAPASLAQIAPQGAPAPAPDTRGLTGMPRIDARRAPASAPAPKDATVSAPAAPPSGPAAVPPPSRVPAVVTKEPSGVSPLKGKSAEGSPARNAIADCLQLWDKGTHMTKQEWATTCRRVQARIDNAKVDSIVPRADPKRP